MKKSDPAQTGRKGGEARAASLSAARRKQIARKAAAARWAAKVPKTQYAGTIKIGDAELPCAVLDDGRRVLSQTALYKAFGSGNPSKRGFPGDDTYDLPPILSARRLKPYIDEDLAATVKAPIKYQALGNKGGGALALGLEAEVLPKICQVWLDARRAGVLHHTQLPLAEQAENLVCGLAGVGIVALVDEATGYQYERSRNALAEILEKFIGKQKARWVKTFNDDFYKELFRLRGLSPTNLHKRPAYFGYLTNDIVYDRLAPGVRQALEEKNPRQVRSSRSKVGHRKDKHHQWLTRDTGHPQLREHLTSVTTIMKMSSDYDSFIQWLDRLHPRYEDTLQLNLFGDPPPSWDERAPATRSLDDFEE